MSVVQKGTVAKLKHHPQQQQQNVMNNEHDKTRITTHSNQLQFQLLLHCIHHPFPLTVTVADTDTDTDTQLY